MAGRWSIEIEDDARRELRKLGPQAQDKIFRYLEKRIAAAGNPRDFGKPMFGEYKGLWRYRVEDYRLICRVEDHRMVVLVVRIGHRRDVYDE